MSKQISATTPKPLGPVTVPVDGDAMQAVNDIERITQALLDMMAGSIQTATPTGTVLPFAGQVAPTGWLLANGQSVSRATYPALYAAIGSTFGSLDANSFALPDLRGRVPVGTGQGPGLTNRQRGQIGGEEMHALTVQELPAHSHLAPTGNGVLGTVFEVVSTDAAQGGYDYARSAPTDNAGENTGHNTMQPYLALNYIVRT